MKHDHINRDHGLHMISCMPFIRKLFRLLNNRDYKDVVTWAPDGNGLSILKRTQFTARVLHNHFKRIKLESFTKQLLNYGFERAAPLRGKTMVYVHRWFMRDQPDQLWRIRFRQPSIETTEIGDDQ